MASAVMAILKIYLVLVVPIGLVLTVLRTTQFQNNACCLVISNSRVFSATDKL